MKQFKSCGAFAQFLGSRIGAAQQARSIALRDAGALIQETAKSYLGIYQEAAGPFPAWDELADRTKKDRLRRELTPNEPLRATGELHEHIDMTTDGVRAVVGVPHASVGDGSKQNPTRDIGEVAIVQELGDARVPARPFLGRAAFVRGEVAAKEIGAAVAGALAGVPIVRRKPVDDIPF